MHKTLKPIPKFKTEAEERHFWETHDSTAYLDWGVAERVRLPNLKPTTTAISLRLPLPLLERIKVAANKRDVPYQSLIKTWLAEKMDSLRRRRPTPPPTTREEPMDLTLTPKHRALQQQVQAFIQTHGHRSPKPGGGRKRPDAKTLAWQKLLVEHGYAARTVPREYGGFGADPDVLDLAVIADAFSAANMYQGLTNQGISMLVPTLLEVGTEDQRREWIGPTIRGEVIWCQGYSEPASGSDLAAASTRAMLDRNDFVVNGQKTWTSSAHYADMMFLLCRTEPDLPKHEGLSYLLLSMQSPGIEVRPLKTMTGRSEFNEVFFTDVRVPAKQIVLGRGKGWYVANITLKHERLMIGDAGKMTHRLEQLITLLQSTSVDGRRLIEMPEFRDRLLKLQGEVLAWKAHNLRLLTEAAKGEESGVKRMIVKYGGTMLGFRLSSLAVDALGAAGLPFESMGEAAEDDDATTWNIDYMYDVGLMIGGGSNNIQKNIIGERGLGLPREPKPAATATIGRS